MKEKFLKKLKKLDTEGLSSDFIGGLQERISRNNIQNMSLINSSNNLAQLFYNLARNFKGVDFNSDIDDLFAFIISDIKIDIEKQVSLRQYNKNIFRYKGWLMASFILNPKLRQDHYLPVYFEEIIYTTTDCSGIGTESLIKHLSQLLQVSNASSNPARFKIISSLMGEINKKTINIKDFAARGDATEKFNNICFDIINYFERVEEHPELQEFISKLMKLSSETMNDNLIRAFILLHKNYEFSLYEKNTVMRDSAINTIKSIYVLLENGGCKLSGLVSYLRFISTLDIDIKSTHKVLNKLVEEIKRHKKKLSISENIEINWSLMLLEQSGHSNITYLDLENLFYDDLDLAHKSMLYQFLIMRGLSSFEAKIPVDRITKSKTENTIVKIIKGFLKMEGIEYKVDESCLYKGLQIDFLIDCKGQKIAFNIDGPYHFLSKLCSNKPSSRFKKTTKLRNAMQKKLKLLVICIDYRDNDEQIKEKVTEAISNLKPTSEVATPSTEFHRRGRGFNKRSRGTLFFYEEPGIKRRITGCDSN